MARKKEQPEVDWFRLDDHILIKAHLKGDAVAFEVLFKKHREQVARLVYSIVKDEALTEDIVQDVFLLVYRNLPKFRGDAAFKTWVYRIAVNEAMRQMSKARRWSSLPQERAESLSLPPTILTFQEGDSPERVLIEGEQRHLIQEALDSLKANHRIILTLYYLEDLSVQEIAQVLDIPEGSVKSRLYYARDNLKKALEPLLGREHPAGREENHVV